MGEVGVALDDGDRAGKTLLAQEVCDRAADDRAADDDDVVPCHVVRPVARLAGVRVTAIAVRRLARASIARQEDQMKRKDSPRRSVLYVPASNAKAMGKIASLACDAVILDLEDAVGPQEKAGARDNLRAFFAAPPALAGEIVIRINASSGEWGRDDLDLAAALAPDAVLLPKVDTPRDVLEAGDFLDEHGGAETALWAMVETPKAILNIGAIAELGRDPASRRSWLVGGPNDLVKGPGVLATPDRRYLQAWLMQIVLAARSTPSTA